MEMADTCVGNDLMNVEILIGSDLFWEIILNEQISINKDPEAIKTVLDGYWETEQDRNWRTGMVVLKILQCWNAVEINDLGIF